MFPFTLYTITAIITGFQIYSLLTLAIWGVPTHSVQFIAFFGSVVLLIAGYVSLFGSRRGGYIAFAACLLLWSFYAPATVSTVDLHGLRFSDIFTHAVIPLGFLVATTAHSWILIRRKPAPPAWIFPAAATTHACVGVGIVTLLLVVTLALIVRFGIGTERVIVEEAVWSYGDNLNKEGHREIEIRFVP